MRPPLSFRRGWLCAAAALGPGLLGCAHHSPFPVVGPLGEAETARVLAERARAVHSLYALVRVSMDSGEMSGTFDVACHYQEPGRLRMAAFKDVLLSTRTLFDLVFTETEYAVCIHGEEGAELHRGKLERFPADHGEMEDLYWLREAIFLPGSGGGGALAPNRCEVRPPAGPGEPARAEGRTAGGLSAVWLLDPLTLEIREAEVRLPPDGRPVRIRYRDYRAEGGAFIPGRVSVDDARGPFRMQCILRDLEVNPVLDPSVFVLEEPAGGEARRS